MNDEKEMPVEVFLLKSKFPFPMGAETFIRIQEENPEYFKEELAYRRKWEAVPQDIKDAYFKELTATEMEACKKYPWCGKGLLWNALNYQNIPNVKEQERQSSEETKEIEKTLHDKYFKQFEL